MSDDERETARAERRHVIESNKAWKAATEVRRRWLTTTFAGRKTAPAGAEAYLARVITDGWAHQAADADTLRVAGFGRDDDTPGYLLAYQQRHVVADAIAAATPKRALQIALALAVAMWETSTQPNTWRSPGTQTPITLARLKEWGYPTSDIEDRIIAEADAAENRTD